MTTSREDGAFRVVAEGADGPEVSILVPTCEQERFVAAAVASVLAQRDVVAEVLISDDASSDRTWDQIEAAVRSAPPHPHRVVLRRGSVRLRRDHTPLLADHASAPIVLAAHGDDIAAPERARRLVDELERSGAVLIGSDSTPIDEHGRPTIDDVSDPPDEATGTLLGPEAVTRPRRDLQGALVAWRPGALHGFERLDQRFAPASHDRILPFRAALAGEVTVVREPLVRRRRHTDQWSLALTDGRSAPARAFGSALIRLATLDAMARDLERAAQLGLVDDPRRDRLRTLLGGESDQALGALLDANHELVVDGQAPLWVTERELRLAAEGALTSSLLRRARVQRPVARLLSASRALRASRRQTRR